MTTVRKSSPGPSGAAFSSVIFHITCLSKHKIFGNFTLIFAINSLTKPFKNDKIDRYGKYARIMVCARCRFAAVGAELIYAEESNQEEFL